jgi:hypothetical protein
MDATVSEDHVSDLEITENPIESGAEIADHAVLKPKQITVSGVVVAHDPASLPSFLDSALGGIRDGMAFLNSLIPSPLQSMTDEALSFAKNNLPSGFVEEAQGQARVLAPWLPDFLDFSSFGGSSDRIAGIHEDLLAVQKSGETIEIQTGAKLYENMLISSVGLSTTNDNVGVFTIAAREVFIVETSLIDGVKISSAGKKKSGRAAIQGASKDQRGSVNTTAGNKSKSVLLNGKGGTGYTRKG